MPTINFAMENQQELLWCWAAVSISVDKSLPPRESAFEQCNLAEAVLPGAQGCCGAPRPAACKNEATLRDGLTAVDRAPGPVTGPLSFNNIKRELKAPRRMPVCIV